MLRRTCFVIRPKVARSWTKESISAAAHFPDAVRAADPAAVRGSMDSAKEQRVWRMDEGNRAATPYVRQVPKHIQGLVNNVKLYGQLVRFDKPVGTLLLLVPCFWGSSLAVTRALVWEGADPLVLCAPFIPIHLAVFFTTGAFLMRSAGCIVNDMWDRKCDAMVERTKNRPLACGAISMPAASAILVVHVMAAAVIALNLAPAALYTSALILPLVVIYPFMKRITHMPQFFLGLCFNWGIFVGYAAVLGRVDLAVTLPIYCGAVIWTILYDTIYAYQDRSDDLKCGVKSSAILIGDRKYILSAMVLPIGAGMLISGLLVSQSLPYYVCVVGCLFYLHGIVDHVNIYDSWSCATGFRRNVRFGWFVFAAMIAGNTFWAISSEHQKDKDVVSNTMRADSSLMNFLSLSARAEDRAYTTDGIRWVDRFAHPAMIQAREAAKNGVDPDALVIPAWMRREYLGENVGRLLLLAGVSAEQVSAWQKEWYELLDHYNVFSAFAL